MLDHPVDAGDDLRHVGGAMGIGHFDVDHVGVRRGTDELACVLAVLRGREGGIVARDDPRHVGPVAETVEVGQARRLRVEGDVGPVDDLAGAQSLHRRDARVDEGDADALAGIAGGPELLEAGHASGVVERAHIGRGVVAAEGAEADRAVGGHGGDARIGAQRRELVNGNHCCCAAQDGQRAGDRATELADGRGHRRLTAGMATDHDVLGLGRGGCTGGEGRAGGQSGEHRRGGEGGPGAAGPTRPVPGVVPAPVVSASCTPYSSDTVPVGPCHP